MRKDMDKVTFGFFPKFRKPTILFFGSDKPLDALHRVLLSLDKNKNLKLEEDNNFIPLNGIKVALSLAERSRGMRIEDVEQSKFRWTLSKEDAIRNAEKVFAVIKSKEPCHHYLDGPSDDVEVVVSKGEYPDTFVP